jgi:hypothetical protein
MLKVAVRTLLWNLHLQQMFKDFRETPGSPAVLVPQTITKKTHLDRNDRMGPK